jgi:DNA polymerase III subunit epsilon
VREIVFDTETTGLDPASGHRVVEIGCVELLNGIPTGRTFHTYLDPQRDMPAEALAVHGLTAAFLSDKPVFAAVADAFVAFVEGAKLVAHNAEFDFRFMSAELVALGRPPLDRERMVDTAALARRRHPGSPASLDALCSRYGIDNSRRTKHGALLDAEILAEVYAELTGGRQTTLMFAGPAARGWGGVSPGRCEPRPIALPSPLTIAELGAHDAFVDELGPGAIWLKYAAPPAVEAQG